MSQLWGKDSSFTVLWQILYLCLLSAGAQNLQFPEGKVKSIAVTFCTLHMAQKKGFLIDLLIHYTREFFVFHEVITFYIF